MEMQGQIPVAVKPQSFNQSLIRGLGNSPPPKKKLSYATAYSKCLHYIYNLPRTSLVVDVKWNV